ncbi:YrhB domain-containing protein [Saccharopolyspora sp. NFXS83]|uniref:YrhB domain-containing protein n=1 Tax=Saccharopolyspora sp. NFXS83 TaxID=2993560 RepID=UPI00224B967F|nr:YrhB domain-containing protein [Saccharopolyspora sp. NFXS83]MCX2731761.1 YrhB domain-containing protein [Saccharopolyspora sp. NFXS83]
MSDDPARRGAEWLERTYGGLVTLTSDEPLVDGERNLLFGCDYATGSSEPLLAATIAVPKDGRDPFPVANAEPLNEDINVADAGAGSWRWRSNARGCLIATDAAVDHRPASALPWEPMDEAPGWWGRMLAKHFPDAELSTCSTWQDATSMIVEGGPGTRGVMWLRRQLGGVEITGHLLYAFHDEDQVIVLDGQQGTLASLNDDEVAQIEVARFHRPLPGAVEIPVAPWEGAAEDLESAIGKAESWLAHTYLGDAVLVEPDAADEMERGWLFACTTPRFLESGDWRDQMLDAALVVPKESGEAPFGLPNDDPWAYLSTWDGGADDLPEPPLPANAAWYEPTVRELGEPLSTSVHQHWGDVLSELSEAPEGARALVWVRRQDARERETVGNLLVATQRDGGVRVVDSLAEQGFPAFDQEPLGLHVVRFE